MNNELDKHRENIMRLQILCEVYGDILSLFDEGKSWEEINKYFRDESQEILKEIQELLN